jgi:hypothetical protein
VPFTTTVLPISTTLPGTYASALTQTITLTNDWQPYTITVPFTHTLDMTDHIGGFFAYLDPIDNPAGAEVFLDDIIYHFDDSADEMLDYNVLVADVNSWGLMALGEKPRYGKTVDWIYDAFLVTETIDSQTVSGFDFDIDKDGIWPEGTCQVILAFQIAGRQEWSDGFLSDVVVMQERAPHANRKGLVAALHDCLTTNLGWFYYNRLHVAPTAWYIFAARGYNPYWGISTSDEIPHQGPIICTPVQLVHISGPTTAFSGTMVILTVFYTPTHATSVTLLWDNGKTGSSTSYTWTEGVYTAVVTATAHCGGPVTATHTVTVTAHRIYLPLMMRSYLSEPTESRNLWPFEEQTSKLRTVTTGKKVCSLRGLTGACRSVPCPISARYPLLLIAKYRYNYCNGKSNVTEKLRKRRPVSN